MYIGTDESGKGDYFGYLVAAAVITDKNKNRLLRELKVRDSKKLTEKQIFFLSDKIEKLCKHNIVKISPEKYNNLYKKMDNLNKILAWCHARVIENLLSKNKNVECVISDQFGDKKYLKNALMKRGRKIKLIQKTKAESDLAVAAASVLARKHFILTLKHLSKKAGMKLPKGATHVKNTAKKLKRKDLRKFAKVHFKITEQL